MKPLLLAMCCLFLGACHASSPRESESLRPLRVLVYNIKHGEGLDHQLDLERVAQLIRQHDPDVVTLQEVDRGCGRTGSVDQAKWLGEACGMHPAFGAFMDYDGGEYGMAVLSRSPIIDVENIRLPDGSEPRTALAVRVSSSVGEVIVCGIHFYRTEAERMAQAEVVSEHFRESEIPVLLAGDFNSQPGGPVMERLAETWEILPKQGAQFTFPADEPDREIDYCLVRTAGKEISSSLVVIDEPLVSDHRPLLLELHLR
jgi:endonuclease/exonuclease/phosphatase family metal-dependent hydrolase